MSSKAKAKNIVVDVMEEEYQADLARGFQEDEVLKPGRHTFKRGGFLSRHGLKPGQPLAPVKVRISINLDLDYSTTSNNALQSRTLPRIKHKSTIRCAQSWKEKRKPPLHCSRRKPRHFWPISVLSRRLPNA